MAGVKRDIRVPEVSRGRKVALAAYLSVRVEYWRKIMGEEPITWTMRNMKTQWGNCRARRRHLTFNLQLSYVPNRLRDYIIVHELSHLQVQNHGPLFKARESQFLPDWPSRRKELREYEKAMIAQWAQGLSAEELPTLP